MQVHFSHCYSGMPEQFAYSVDNTYCFSIKQHPSSKRMPESSEGFVYLLHEEYEEWEKNHPVDEFTFHVHSLELLV